MDSSSLQPPSQRLVLSCLRRSHRSPGSGWHFDAHDSLIVCVRGDKRFRIASADAVPGTGAAPAVEVMMTSGDAVFVPAGTYHCGSDGAGAGGDGGPSVVLSIGLRSDVRSAPLLTARLRDDSERWQMHHFFTGRQLQNTNTPTRLRAKRSRAGGGRDNLEQAEDCSLEE
eukprot:4209312-Prymnesium_polylepis.2